MSIAVGDTIPNVTVHILDENGVPKPVQTHDVLGTGKVVLFAVPGAFTPGCSNVHLPGYVKNRDSLHAKGVDTIACISVNDPWVLDSWSKAHGADGIIMLGDGSGAFAKAVGLDMDGSGFGLGVRSLRYSAILEDGVVKELNVEEGPGITVSACEIVLDHL
jgi:peroxiredoxin